MFSLSLSLSLSLSISISLSLSLFQSPRGVMASVLDSEFELQPRYYVIFLTKRLGRGMTPLYPRQFLCQSFYRHTQKKRERNSQSYTNTSTHTHTHIYIYECVCMYISVHSKILCFISIYFKKQSMLVFYTYIVMHRQTLSLYHNSNVWLETRDASSWDRNPADFTPIRYLYRAAISNLSWSKGILTHMCPPPFFGKHIRLTATKCSTH